jgi:hypothetical protein
MDFDEDQSQARTAAAPGVVAGLRNLTITILRLTGATSIAAALRDRARRQPAPTGDHELLNDFAGTLRFPRSVWLPIWLPPGRSAGGAAVMCPWMTANHRAGLILPRPT